MDPITKLINWFSEHNGYVETPVNRTKFAEHLDSIEVPRIPRQGSAWCGTFIDDGFVSTGLAACLLTKNYGTSAAAQVYIRNNRWSRTPRIGDLAFYKTAGPGHIGYVSAIDGLYIYTWEGNTSSSVLGSQRNGGEVAYKRRRREWWAGFGTPNYSKADESIDDLAELIAAVRKTEVKKGDRGIAVQILQNILKIPADGIFGAITQGKLVSFQTFVGLPVTGRTDSRTWAALFGEANAG